MKKLLLAFVAVLGIALVGCGHTHTYSDEWSSDDTYHWHAATCGHTEEQGNKEEHKYDKNGVCMICHHERQHVHENLTLVPEVPATCTEAGRAAYYECSCGKLFDKATGGNEVELKDLVIEAKEHDKDLIHHGSEVATCVQKSVKEHWECGSCHTLFSDSAGKEVVAEKDVVGTNDPSNHARGLVPHAEVVPTCASTGNVEYYECEACHAKYDAATNGNLLDDVFLEEDPYNHQGMEGELPLREGYAAYCEANGLASSYYCEACRGSFSDPYGQNPIDENDLRIQPLGHDYGNNIFESVDKANHRRVCRRCGEAETGHDLPHTMKDGICVECGYTESGTLPEKGEFVFGDIIYSYDTSVAYNGSDTKKVAWVSGANQNDSHNYVIVKEFTFGGVEFVTTKLKEDSFNITDGKTKAQMKRIVLPDNLTEIGARAFKGQNTLIDILISKDLEKIDDTAFEDCVTMVVYFTGESEADFKNETVKQSIISKIAWGDEKSIHYYSATRKAENAESYWHYTDEFNEVPELYTDEQEWHDLSSGLIYRYNVKDMTARVVGYRKFEVNPIVSIPETIVVDKQEYTVTSIGRNVFIEMPESGVIRGVILPKSIKTIDSQAFSTYGVGTIAIEYIVMHDGITAIGTDAFDLTPQAKLFFYGTRAEYNAFAVKLEKMLFGEKLSALPSYIYSKQMPSDEMTDRYWHFTDSRKTAADAWNEGRFVGDYGLVYSYDSVSGTATVIDLEGTTELYIKIPESITVNGKSYSVTAIGDRAFACTMFSSEGSIVGIEIPYSVKTIGDSAFAYQSFMEYIVIHGDVEIGENAFYSAFASSVKIYFLGSETEYDEFRSQKNSFTEAIQYHTEVYVYIYSDTVIPSKYYIWRYTSSGSIEELTYPETEEGSDDETEE